MNKTLVVTALTAGLFAGSWGLAQSTPTNPAETLRSLADARGLYIGAAVAPIFYDPGEPDYPKVLVREFNMVVAENIMKWAALSSGRNSYSFFAADALASFAKQNKLALRGHTLVWHESLPSWVTVIKDKEELRAVLKNHIQTVVKHFRGQVFAWDALNEAVLDEGSYRKTVFYNVIGPDYIADIFRWAHEADPDVKLFYNDYNAEGINAKSDFIYEMLKSLKAKGVPIDGVGFQTHVDSNFSVAGSRMVQNFERFRALGLEVQMTEIDVTLAGNTTPQVERLAAQAKVYKDLMQGCLSVQCTAFVTWGFTDAFSWRTAGRPLPFDSDYLPKPAYYALIEALKAPAKAIVPATTTAATTPQTAVAPFVFANFTALQNIDIVKTEYNQVAGDAKVEKIAVNGSNLVIDYRLAKDAGSTFAGAGANMILKQGKTFDATAYSALQITLASSKAMQLRVRISSTDSAVVNSGCYPIVMVNVTPELKRYTLALKDFAAPSYCGSGARDIKQTLLAVALIEVADEGLPNNGPRLGQIQIGQVAFVK
jgi:endo-1,4-beta-xylanase